MEDILLLMEQTCKPYIKKFVLFFVLLFLAELGWSTFCINPDMNIFMNLQFTLFFVVSFLMLIYLHLKRYKKLIKGGGFTRIQLLPLKKTTFLHSELLFILSTIATVISIQYLVWFMILYMNLDAIKYAANGFMITTFMNSNISWIPYTISEVISFLLILIFFTYFVVSTCFVLVDVEKRIAFIGSIILLLMSVPFIIHIIMTSIGSESPYTFESLGLLCLVLIPIMHHHLLRTLLVKRRTIK